MNELNNHMSFFALLVFNSENFELDFCPFFLLHFLRHVSYENKSAKVTNLKNIFSVFLMFNRRIHVSTVAIKANFVEIAFILAAIKTFVPKSGRKMSRQLRWNDPRVM